MYSKQGKDIEGFELANEVGTITTNNAQPKTNDLPNVEATTIRVKSPNGKIGTIPATQLEDALAAGYTRL